MPLETNEQGAPPEPPRPDNTGSRDAKKAMVRQLLDQAAKEHADKQAAEEGQQVTDANTPMPDGGAVQHQPGEPGEAPPEGEPAAAEATPEGEQPTEQAEKERKGRKAREWAAARQMKAEAAQERREAKRERQRITEERAELQKEMSEMRELRELMQKSPGDFIKKISGGNIRPLLQTALDEDELTEEQRTIRGQQSAIEELKSELKQMREESSKEREEREKREKESEERAQHQSRIRGVKQALEQKVDQSDYPYAFCYDTDALSQECYRRAWQEYQRTGLDLDLGSILEQIDGELKAQHERFQKVSGARATEQPSEQGNGAGQGQPTPGAKHPPTLSSDAASARAGGSRPLDREEKRARAARLLKRTG